MKKFSILVLVASLVMGLGLTALAGTQLDVNVVGTGYTQLYEELRTTNLFVEEFMTNTGSVAFNKQALVSADGMDVTEFKNLSGSGVTTYFDKAVIGGFNSLAGDVVPTGYITEQIVNVGVVQMGKSLVSVGDWSLLESKNIEASGVTSVDKYVGSWTTHQPWVTDAMADIEFVAGGSYFLEQYYHIDQEDGDQIIPSWGQAIWSANNTPGKPNKAWGDIAIFSSELVTNQDLSYEELAIINPGYFAQ